MTPLEYWSDASWGDIKPATVKQSNLYRKVNGRFIPVPDITLIDVTDPHARRTSFGWIGVLAGGPISWRSQVQQGRRALSTCEAELHAATEAAKDILHVKELLGHMLIQHDSPIALYEDNQSTIRVVTRLGITARTKHYELRLYFLRDLRDVINILIFSILGSLLFPASDFQLGEDTYENPSGMAVLNLDCIRGDRLECG